MLRSCLHVIFITFCCVFATISFAEPIVDSYQIEVIIFEHMDSKRFAAEHWPKFVGNLHISKAVNLSSVNPDTVADSIALIDSKRMLLNSEANKIKNSKTERLIQHMAWRQSLYINDKSTPVYFTGGNDDEVATIVTIKPARNIFNVYIDMIYKLQPHDKYLAPGISDIRVTRDIKLKQKEIFYVDHPVIGMLVTIVPIMLDNN